MEVKNNWIRRIFWFSAIILGIWIIFIRPEVNISKLKKEGQETKGVIYRKSGVGSKGTIRCFYNFDVDGKQYEGFYDTDDLKQWDSIEIIYYSKDPALNQSKKFVQDY